MYQDNYQTGLNSVQVSPNSVSSSATLPYNMGSINLNNPCSVLFENQGQTITQMNNLDMSDQNNSYQNEVFNGKYKKYNNFCEIDEDYQVDNSNETCVYENYYQQQNQIIKQNIPFQKQYQNIRKLQVFEFCQNQEQENKYKQIDEDEDIFEKYEKYVQLKSENIQNNNKQQIQNNFIQQDYNNQYQIKNQYNNNIQQQCEIDLNNNKNQQQYQFQSEFEQLQSQNENEIKFGLDYDINFNQDCLNEKSYNNNSYQFDQNFQNNSLVLGSQEKQSNFYITDNNQQQQNNLNFDFEFNNVRNEREETDSQNLSRDSKLLKKKIYKKNYNQQQISNQRQKVQKQKLVGSDNSPEIQKIKKNFWKNLSRHFFYHLKHASVIIRKEVLEERFNLNKQQCEKFAKKYGTGKLKMNNKEEFLSLLFPVAISSKQQLIQQQQQSQQNCEETQLFKKILRILLLRFMRRDMFQHSTQVSRIQNWYLFFIQRHTLAKQVQGHCLKKLFF